MLTPAHGDSCRAERSLPQSTTMVRYRALKNKCERSPRWQRGGVPPALAVPTKAHLPRNNSRHAPYCGEKHTDWPPRSVTTTSRRVQYPGSRLTQEKSVYNAGVRSISRENAQNVRLLTCCPNVIVSSHSMECTKMLHPQPPTSCRLKLGANFANRLVFVRIWGDNGVVYVCCHDGSAHACLSRLVSWLASARRTLTRYHVWR